MVNNLEKQEYAKIAHIINSKKMKKGKNIVYSDLYIYDVYWNKFDDWIIYNMKNIEGDLYENERKNEEQDL